MFITMAVHNTTTTTTKDQNVWVYGGSSVGNILYITAVGIYVYVLNSKISAVKFTLASFKILS